MIQTDNRSHRSILKELARIAMTSRGLLPDFSPEAIAELDLLKPDSLLTGKIRDQRYMCWCSIDNHDSRDLDQLTVAEALPDGFNRLLVAIADVDTLVRKGSAIDQHARQNTTSIYTTAEVFPMLPERLSTDLTSLNYHCERMALVVDMTISKEGEMIRSDVYRALVRSRAKLDYITVGAWIEGDEPVPLEISRVAGLADNIKLQDTIAVQMKKLRHSMGALDFESRESTPVFEGDMILELRETQRTRARDIIEEFMICTNEATATFLADKKFPTFRRIVKNPKRWTRICEIASESGVSLPIEPNSKALQEFMAAAKKNDPDNFPDLSLSIIKLLGPGEYAIGFPEETSEGHFGLAVRNYSHSTAPNRRYPDLITHRLLKSAIEAKEVPYTHDELESLALHCTQKEDDAKKVERQVSKSAAALVLEHHIGEEYDAIVTGAAEKGTWVRIQHPHIEGRIISGAEGLDVGLKIRVQLVATDIENGYIDFKKV
jgi:exoribonuclease-2